MGLGRTLQSLLRYSLRFALVRPQEKNRSEKIHRREQDFCTRE
jgi:hypothetical protein